MPSTPPARSARRWARTNGSVNSASSAGSRSTSRRSYRTLDPTHQNARRGRTVPTDGSARARDDDADSPTSSWSATGQRAAPSPRLRAPRGRHRARRNGPAVGGHVRLLGRRSRAGAETTSVEWPISSPSRCPIVAVVHRSATDPRPLLRSARQRGRAASLPRRASITTGSGSSASGPSAAATRSSWATVRRSGAGS